MLRGQKPRAYPLHEPARIAARKAAAEAWGRGDAQTRQRTAILIAAFILDGAAEYDLADWLLRAKPEHVEAVGAGVAAHALRRDVPAAWDALAAVNTMDLHRASELYDVDGDLCWQPEQDWLIPSKGESC
jgi:hypothetical protein